MRRSRRTYGWIGWGLLGAGLALAISVPARFLMLEAHGQQRLLRAQQTFASQAVAESGVNQLPRRSVLPAHSYAVAPASGAYRLDGLIGLLQIPSLALTASLAQGITDQVLSSAVGHLVGSSLPGQLGDSLLAAHNATWFRHIDRLRVGDVILVTTKDGRFAYRVTGSQVVHTDAPVAQSARPTLILESCYPLDALYFTPYRQLVFASLVSSDQGMHDQDDTIIPKILINDRRVKHLVTDKCQVGRARQEQVHRLRK